MGVKSWSPGDVLTASDMDAWTVPLVAGPTTGDMTLTSQPAFQNDVTLFVAVAANAVYEVRLHAAIDGPNGNTLLWAFTGPAGAAGSFSQVAPAGGSTTASTEWGLGATFAAAGTQGVGSNSVLDVAGVLVTAGNAGTFQFQWCQGASSATATRRRARSLLTLRRTG